MKKFAIETYGCRMNICDSEVIISILTQEGFVYSEEIALADVIILNSCSVREDGHNKIFERLYCIEKKVSLSSRIIVITGCFASLLTKDFFIKYPFVNIIANPNSYRLLPSLLNRVESGEKHLLVPIIENDELYDDILPKRYIEDKTTAAINVMKGCSQCCSYCIEPITRGNEHCRSVESILKEAKDIAKRGYRELTLVGHLIDKYKWQVSETGEVINFAMLLGMVAETCPQLRIKFLSSHPAFFDDDIARTVAYYPNIMKVIHLPIQSASNVVLKRMNRGYTKEMFLEKIQRIRTIIPQISIITDIMVGFCGETDEDFKQTEEFVKKINFDDINVFRFSMRSGTKASLIYVDDVPELEKMRRANVIKELNNSIRQTKFQKLVGTEIEIIVEGSYPNRRMYGRDMNHRTVIIESQAEININDKVSVNIKSVTPDALCGVCL